MDSVASPQDKVVRSTEREPITGSMVASWILMGVALLAVVLLHLVSALTAGLLVYQLVSLLAPLIERHLMHRWSRWLAVASLAMLTIIVFILAGFGLAAFLKSEASSPAVLSEKLNQIITEARNKLPPFLVESFPGNVDDLKTLASGWLDEHSKEVQQIGKDVLHFFIRGLVGMIIGALVSLLEVGPHQRHRPLAAALIERISRFAILPALGIHLPLAKTLIAITFFAGLLPVVGNLISNTAIFIAGLSVSVYAAAFALIFLVLIHKLEYFFNARIVGSSIHARAWELLVAMLVMEVAFGIGGLVVAPIYYAYVKRELSDRNLV
jgi:predicted PurR-regulated permease PerM